MFKQIRNFMLDFVAAPSAIFTALFLALLFTRTLYGALEGKE